jgi:hypothetical protein
MAKMGVREFRDNFTTIAREAKGPVVVTNHDTVVGWFTPANKPQRPVADILADLKDVRRSAEARGVDVAGRLKALGIEDEALFADPWSEARPGKRERKATTRRRK